MSHNGNFKPKLEAYLEKIKSFGYRIFIPKSADCYSAYIVNDDGIVSAISLHYFGGVEIRTIHKPNVRSGTGFMVAEMIGINDITKELIEESFLQVPRKFRPDFMEAKKVSIDELKASRKNFDDEYVEFKQQCIMSIIDEIKQARNQLLSNDNKGKILARIKVQLIREPFAVIDGAKHYSRQEWDFRGLTYVRAPYACHTAIAVWLEELGFKTSRYYNNGGIDNGLKVWF